MAGYQLCMVTAVKRGFAVGDLLRCEGKNHIFIVSWCGFSRLSSTRTTGRISHGLMRLQIPCLPDLGVAARWVSALPDGNRGTPGAEPQHTCRVSASGSRGIRMSISLLILGYGSKNRVGKETCFVGKD